MTPVKMPLANVGRVSRPLYTQIYAHVCNLWAMGLVRCGRRGGWVNMALFADILYV